MAHEILNSEPYTYLDDAPLEERRARAVTLRRTLPESARDLARLDPEAIERVRDEAWPDSRDAEELHDVLLELVVLRPEPAWEAWFDDLAGSGRGASVRTAAGPLWIAAEQRPAWRRCSRSPGRAGRPRTCRHPAGGRRGGGPRLHDPRPPGSPRAVHRRRAGRAHRSRRGRDSRPPRPARGGRLRDAGALRSRPGRQRGVLRASAPRPHSPLHDGPPAPRDRARHRAGPRALPPALAARRPGHAARGPSGSPDRDRAAPGVRDRGGLLGAVRAAGARPRLQA